MARGTRGAATAAPGAGDGRADPAFAGLVRDALAHLYDPVALRRHPLPGGGGRGAAASPPGSSGLGAGRALQRELLAAVEALRPAPPAGAGAAATARGAGRRHRLLELRYVEALPVAAVQARLAISRAEYFRAHQRAVAAVADVLRARWGPPDGDGVAGAAAPAARPTNLPRPLTSFVGRERELAEVRRLLDAAPLVTLTGPGGVGKTRLALQAAAALLDRFPDGVWLVELAPLGDGALVPQAVAAAVGVREAPGRPLVETLTAALTPKGLLLVLDNCEHLVAACARLADALLRACPGLRLLATSREALDTAGEAPYPVPPLALPDPRRRPPVAALGAYEAVRLFVERGATAQPGFALTAQNAAAVAQICTQLDGLPLALELAAARVRVLPPAQLLGRLADRFRLLTGGHRTALARHQTLRAAVDWSYALLAAPERVLFARLSVFAGGFTLEAAEQVGAGGEIAAGAVLDLLTRLVDTSLVVAAGQADGTARYRQLETLRQYGQEQLAARGEAATARDRHAAHVVAQAEARAGRVQGARTIAERDFGWFAREADNVRAALGWLRDRGDAAGGLRLGAFLDAAWLARGHLSEGRAWLAALLALPAAAAPTGPRAQALVALARLAQHQGDYAAARGGLAEGLAVARAAGDRQQEVWALFYLANLAVYTGDLAAARGGAAALRAAAGALGDADWQADVDRLLGLIALQRGAYAAARAHLEAALALWRAAAGPRGNLSFVLEGLGHAALGQGDRAGARARFAESLAVARANGRPAMVAGALDGFAGLAAAARPERAVRLAGAAAAVRAALGSPIGPAAAALLEWELAPARRVLSPERYAAAWTEGQALPLEQAIADALADAPAAPPGGGAGHPRPPGGLTAREREVAALVAGGLTNREIAARLVIGERTAETHVEHLLAKLGFRTRAQIAAWVGAPGGAGPAAGAPPPPDAAPRGPRGP